MLTKLKAYAIAFFVFLLGALGFAAKHYKGQAKKEKQKRRRAEAVKEHLEDVAEADQEIDRQTSSRRADAANEIKNRGHSDLLSDPNRVWDNQDGTD
jgi:Flp pilus assembly protein TadB